jgi:hypothetical protein
LIGATYRNATAWEAEEALVSIGKPAVKPLAEALKNDRRSRHIGLFWVLREIGPAAKPAVPALEACLKAEETKDKLHAAIAIVYIDPANQAVKGVLTAALKHSERRVRLQAAEAMSRSESLKTKEAMAALIDIIRDKKVTADHFNGAVIALAKFGPAGNEALPALLDTFKQMRDTPFEVMLAGAIIMVDPMNKEARASLEAHRALIEQFDTPRSDRRFREFGRDLLDNVLKTGKQSKK